MYPFPFAKCRTLLSNSTINNHSCRKQAIKKQLFSKHFSPSSITLSLDRAVVGKMGHQECKYLQRRAFPIVWSSMKANEPHRQKTKMIINTRLDIYGMSFRYEIWYVFSWTYEFNLLYKYIVEDHGSSFYSIETLRK